MIHLRYQLNTILSTLFGEQFKRLNKFQQEFKSKIRLTLFGRARNSYLKGFFKNPFFYFGWISCVLLGLFLFSSNGLAQLSYFKNSDQLSNSFFQNNNNSENADLFFSQSNSIVLETPDLKTTQDDFIYGISTPRLLTPQTLGALFGGSSQERKDIVEYSVQAGDNIESVADNFNISLNTILWANNLSKNSKLTVGQKLVILPVSGLTHIVKSGNTVGELARVYKAKTEEIIAFNDLKNEGDIFIGDILVIPGGTMPLKSLSAPTTTLADNFFIFPTEGKITQGLHWYNAVDIGNKCGTPVYAAASGTVQRARYGWNYGGGNQITILHSSGVVTYYGHLSTIFVNSGEKVEVGTRIGLIGNNGISTGCHLHFGVTGSANPLTRYLLGSLIKYK